MLPTSRLSRRSSQNLRGHTLLGLALSLTTAALLAACGARAAPAPLPSGMAEAVFAGGCFWCMESDFEHLDGVLFVESGYAGGKELNPTYEQVSAHRTSHLESVRVGYDPKLLPYVRLVEYFFTHVDPTQADGQFCDHGPQYRSAIFVKDQAERAAVQSVRAQLQKRLAQPIVTEILPAAVFYQAEDYHQDFYKKQPEHYHGYRTGCGRDARVQDLWGKKPGAH